MREAGLSRKKLLGGLTALAALACGTALAQDREISLITAGGGLVEPEGFSISADGGMAAFATTERLTSGDTDDVRDVYLRRNGELILASQGEFVDQTPRPMGLPVVSQDGSRVFFVTQEKLDFADQDAAADVYAWSGDRAQLISGPASGRPQSDQDAALAGNRVPAPTADKAIIQTTAPLTENDGDAVLDLYEVTASGPRLLTPGTPSAVTPLNGTPSLSHIVFSTPDALDPVNDKDGAGLDTYVTVGGSYTLLSRGLTPEAANTDHAYTDFVSSDGERYFVITLQPLDKDDVDDQYDVYLVPKSGPIAWVSRAGTCGAPPCRADSYAANADLSRLAITSNERLTTGDIDNQPDVYRWADGTLELMSTGPAAAAPADVAVLTLPGGRARITPDGRGVLFTTAEKLVSEDNDGATDLYERYDGETRLVSKGELDAPQAIDPPDSGVYRNGSDVVFSTTGALMRTDTDGRLDVYVREGGALSVVSGGKEAFDAELIGASDDGARIFFRTREALTGDDTDEGARDYFQARRRPQNVTPPSDTTAPQLGVRLTRTKFRTSSRLARVAAKRKRSKLGTTIEITLDEAALVNLEIKRLSTGRVSKGKCVKATRRLRRAKKCTLQTSQKGRLSAQRPAGTTKVAFYGRLPGGKRLKAGRYRLYARAYDAAGNGSALREATFTVAAR